MKNSGLFISERYLHAHRLIGEDKSGSVNSEYLASEIGLRDLTLKEISEKIAETEKELSNGSNR